MYGPTFRFLAAIWFMCAPVAAGAAEIKINEDSAIILEGTIVPGDYDKFRKLINENCPSKSWNLLCPSVIYLASPGGNVTEAIKIGRLVRMLRLGIEVPIVSPFSGCARVSAPVSARFQASEFCSACYGNEEARAGAQIIQPGI
jgi:hypothetical protein